MRFAVYFSIIASLFLVGLNSDEGLAEKPPSKGGASLHTDSGSSSRSASKPKSFKGTQNVNTRKGIKKSQARQEKKGIEPKDGGDDAWNVKDSDKDATGKNSGRNDLVPFSSAPIQMSPDEVRAKLDELRSSIVRKEAEFSEVAARVDKVDKDLRKQSEELGTLSEQQAALEEALAVSKKQAVEVAKRREQTKLVISGVGERFKMRLRAMERRSRSSGQEFFKPEDGQVMYRDLLYFRRIADSDLRLLERIINARNDLERMERNLVQLKQHQEQAERGISERVSSKKTIVELRKQLLLEEKERKATLKKVLASLKSKASEMEGVLRSLTAGIINEEEMPREWFTGLRPPLPIPVSGQLIQGFGKKRLRGLQDLIFSKGLEFAAPVGSGVKVISTGIVRFIGELPGYGVTVMVEHGQRFFSLYGRLKGVEVSQGDTVMQGTQIGSTGDLDFEGRNFYFEIREKGEALDPKRFIALAGGRSKDG